MTESGCATEAIGEGGQEASSGVHPAKEHWGTESVHRTLPEAKGFELEMAVGGMTSCERGYQVERTRRRVRQNHPWQGVLKRQKRQTSQVERKAASLDQTNPDDDGVGDSSRLSSVVTALDICALGPNSARKKPSAVAASLPFLGHTFPLLAVNFGGSIFDAGNATFFFNL